MIANSAGSSVVPTVRYRDLDSAVAWLCTAFGFTPHAIVQDADGHVVSAQLTFGNGMVMLAPVGQSSFDELMKQPDEIGGAETQSCYFVVPDGDLHYAAAKAHGADIVLELQDLDNGGRGYLCRDLEGHLWSFGTFNPWTAVRTTPPLPEWANRALAFTEAPERQLTLAGLTAAGLLAGGIALALSWQGEAPAPGAVAADATAERPSAIALFKERGARMAAERSLASLRAEKETSEGDSDKLQEQLEHLTVAKEAAERSARRLVARAVAERQQHQVSRRRADENGQVLEKERLARQRSERAFQNLKGQLEKELLAKDNIERANAQSEASLAKERETKKRAETGLSQALDQVKKEQDAKKRTEASLQQALAQLKKEQDARKAAEIVAQQTPAPTPAQPPGAKTDQPLAPPRPAKRPEAKQGGSASGGEPLPDFQP